MDILRQVGGAFATGAAGAAGVQPVLEQLTRGLSMFGMVSVGGASWQNSQGTGVVANGTAPVFNGSHAWMLGFGQGARTAMLAAKLKRAPAPPPVPPAPEPTPAPPPAYGEKWSATLATNMTQVGYDAGLVLVNFSGHCGNDPTRYTHTRCSTSSKQQHLAGSFVHAAGGDALLLGFR